MNDVDISKYLSFVLRHNPTAIGITLDPNGYVKTVDLLAAAAKDGKTGPTGTPLTQADLFRVVQNNDKKRFEYSSDGLSIRASQGHSLPTVNLNLTAQTPPDVLYHGTAGRHVDDIKKTGLEKRSGNHVHLSVDINTAIKVGLRHSKSPVILVIDAKKMAADGLSFYLSANQVWLADAVPHQYITFP